MLSWTQRSDGWYASGFRIELAEPFRWLLLEGEPDTAAVGVSALRILSYGYVFYAWAMVMTQAFNGAGDTLTPTWMNFFCFWCFQIPLAWTLATAAGWGPHGVLWAIAISETFLALIAAWMFRRGTWKSVEI